MPEIPFKIYDENFLRNIFAYEAENLLPEFPFNYPPLLAGRKLEKNDEYKILKGWKSIAKNPDEELVIYTHIPFCGYICQFCGFYRKLISCKEEVNSYLKALEKEVSFYKTALETKPVKWLCFGGGTPSILTEKQIEFLFDIFKKNFNVSENTGIAFESSPQSLNFSKAKKLKSLGVKYLAIGVQSFNESLMRKYSRPQTEKQCLKAIENAKKAGIENIEVDLIVGLPGQTEKDFMRDIEIVSKLDLERIYIFDYQPRFLTCKTFNKSASLSEDELDKARNWRKKGIDKLIENGYSLSCGHWVYKRGGHSWPYSYDQQEENAYSILALGASAIGYCKGNFRYQNVLDLKKYINCLEKSNLPVEKIYFLSKRDEMINYILLSLIQRGQLNIDSFKFRFKVDIEKYFKKEIDEMIDIGLLLKSKNLLIVSNRHRSVFVAKALFYSKDIIENLAKNFGIKVLYSKSSEIKEKNKNLKVGFIEYKKNLKKIAKELRERFLNGEKKVVFLGNGKGYISDLPVLLRLAEKIGFKEISGIVMANDLKFFNSKSYTDFEKIIVNISEKDINKIDSILNEMKKLNLRNIAVQFKKKPGNFNFFVRKLKNQNIKRLILYFSLTPTINEIKHSLAYFKIKNLFKQAFEFSKKLNIEIKFLNIPLCILYPYTDLFYSFNELNTGDARESDGDYIKINSCLSCKYLLSCPGPEKEYLRRFGYFEIKAIK